MKYSTSSIFLNFILLAFGFFGSFHALEAQSSVVVDEFTYPDSLQVTIEGGGESDDAIYYLQRSETLGSQLNWLLVDEAVFADQGNGQFVITTGDSFDPGFYRVVSFSESGPVVAEFASTLFELQEGEEGSFVTIKFSSPFTGSLNYLVEGTATSTDYAPLSGTIDVVNSIEARIVIEIADDREMSKSKFLNIVLQSSEGFELGSTLSALVTFRDNDSLWLGSLFEDELEARFDFLTTENSNELEAVLSSDGNGIFPEGEFSADLSVSETQFSASVSNITLSADETFYGSETIVGIVFAASNSVEGQSVSDDLIQGVATLSTTVTALPHLDSSRTMDFFMKRRPTAISDETAPLSDL